MFWNNMNVSLLTKFCINKHRGCQAVRLQDSPDHHCLAHFLPLSIPYILRRELCTTEWLLALKNL